MTEEHSLNPSWSDAKCSEPSAGDRPETEISEVSVALNLEAITHDSLNWQEISSPQSECIAPEVLKTLEQETEQLRQNNIALLNRISQLETALANSQRALQTYQERQPATEALLSQRLEEINTLQEHNKRLQGELEQAHQTTQRQQILVETLTEQLETTQTQVAQLERNCAIAQQRCHEQATQLNQRDKFCLDLQTRLHRQQRYTLQYKNALDRCLELSHSSREQVLNSLDSGPLKLAKIEPGLTPKVVAIKPWSVNHWEESAPIEPEEDRPETSEIRQFPKLEVVSSSRITEPIHHDSTVEKSEELDLNPTFLGADLDELEPPDIPASEIDPAAESGENLASAQPWSKEEPELPVQLPQGNWPSPVVYPLRPAKKRQSLAAIELPSFPRL